MTVSVPSFNFVELFTNILAAILGGLGYLAIGSFLALIIVVCVTSITSKIKG